MVILQCIDITGNDVVYVQKKFIYLSIQLVCDRLMVPLCYYAKLIKYRLI